MKIRELKYICSINRIDNYTINKDGSINVYEDVYLNHNVFNGVIPIKFNEVHGTFRCCNRDLITLMRSPKMIKGNLVCSGNNIKDLKYLSKDIGGYIDLYNNDIRDIYDLTISNNNKVSLLYNPVHILVSRFINRDDNVNWILFFNDCDIIRDDIIIWDRLVFFYDYLNLEINKTWEREIEKYYKIIK
jgi:hypothetical protein